MATTNDIYAEMQRYAPLELAESWDNPGLLVDCGRGVSRVLVTLDITPEVVEEAAAGGCELIVSHHPVIFSPLKKLTPRDVSFQLVQKGISAICMHTNLDAAEGGVNEVLAGIFGMRDWEVFADGCGRVGEVEPITVPELARKAQNAAEKAQRHAQHAAERAQRQADHLAEKAQRHADHADERAQRHTERADARGHREDDRD